MLSKHPILGFILIVTLVLSGLYGRDFSTRGEGREALVAQSIIKNGNWILPRGFDGEVPSKPPFMHWLIAGASLPISDVSEETARIPSALLSILALFVFYRFLAARNDRWFSLGVVLLTASTIEWLRASNGCRVDMCLSASLLIGFVSFYSWFERRRASHFLFCIVCFSIATLCKGPIALALPLAVIAIYLWGSGERHVLRLSKVILGIFIPATLIASVWYFLGYLEGGQDFIKKVYAENVSRMMGTLEDSPHSHGVFYLWLNLPLMLLPWTIPFLFVVVPKIRLVKPKFKLILDHWKGLDGFFKFSLIIIAVYVGFFSIPEGKRSVYLLPVYPFIVYCLCKFYSKFSALELSRFRTGLRFLCMFVLLIFCVSAFLLCCPLDLLTSFLKPKHHEQVFIFSRMAQEVMTQISVLGFIGIAFLLILSLHTFRNESEIDLRSLLGRFVIFVFVLEILLQGVVLRNSANMLSGRVFAEDLKSKIASQESVYSYGYEFYCLSFYLEKTVHRLHQESPPDGGIALVFEDKLEQLRQILGPNATLSIISKSSNSIEELGKTVLAVAFNRSK